MLGDIRSNVSERSKKALHKYSDVSSRANRLDAKDGEYLSCLRVRTIFFRTFLKVKELFLNSFCLPRLLLLLMSVTISYGVMLSFSHQSWHVYDQRMAGALHICGSSEASRDVSRSTEACH